MLTSLRSSDISLPDDWDQETRPQQTYIVKWLLNHDPVSRPTSDQLLASDWLPPVMVEESIMNTMVRNAMKNTSSKAYKHLIDAVMKQPMSVDKDISYDSDTVLQRPGLRHSTALGHVLGVSRRVLELHGAVLMEAPCLLPRGEDWVYSDTDSAVVTVMTRSGDVVSLPYDLRSQFARFIVRSKVTSVKRYCFGQVMREKKIFGVHPRELTECAVDIVTPASDPDHGLADAELLLIGQDIVRSVQDSCVTSVKLFYRISHHGLVSGVLQHFGILDPGLRDKLLQAVKIWDSLPNRAAGQISARLVALGLSDAVASSLSQILEVEVGLSQLSSVLRLVTKRKAEAAEVVKQALADLKNIESMSRSLGLVLETVYSVRSGCVQWYSGHRSVSGVMLQLVRMRQGKSGTKSLDIIAAGARYDTLVRSFADNIKLGDPDIDPDLCPRATGLSVSVDKLVNMISKNESFRPESCQVVVAGDFAEASRVVRDVWSSGVKAHISTTSRTDEAIETARDVGAEYVVMIAADGVAMLSHLDDDGRLVEKKFGAGEISNYLIHIYNSDHNTPLRHESTISVNTSSAPVINYNFDFIDREKYSLSQKKLVVRKSERLATALEKFTGGTHVEVISLGYSDAVVRQMVATLDLDTDQETLLSSLEELIKMYPRHRREFRNIVDTIAALRFTDKSPVIVLFSVDDNTFRIIC